MNIESIISSIRSELPPSIIFPGTRIYEQEIWEAGFCSCNTVCTCQSQCTCNLNCTCNAQCTCNYVCSCEFGG